MKIAQISVTDAQIDMLRFAAYRHQRISFPNIEYRRWGRIFGEAETEVFEAMFSAK